MKVISVTIYYPIIIYCMAFPWEGKNYTWNDLMGWTISFIKYESTITSLVTLWIAYAWSVLIMSCHVNYILKCRKMHRGNKWAACNNLMQHIIGLLFHFILLRFALLLFIICPTLLRYSANFNQLNCNNKLPPSKPILQQLASFASHWSTFSRQNTLFDQSWIWQLSLATTARILN